VKRKVFGVVLVLSLALVPLSAEAHHAPASYCSSSGDLCISVKRVNGVRKFSISTFSTSGRYRNCVKGPDGSRACHRFMLRDPDGDGMYTRSVAWKRYFEYQGDGAYTVSWYQSGYRLGRKLGFHFSL
jgi:hypothetical protein